MSEINTAGTVDLVLEQGVATVTFNRPQARNAMTWAMYQQLSEHCRGFKADAGVRAVVFRGAGGQAFVAGTDIEQFKTFSSGDDGVAYEAQIEACIDLLCSLPMPTVALIEGWAWAVDWPLPQPATFDWPRLAHRWGCRLPRRWATVCRWPMWRVCARLSGRNVSNAC
jgi:hypothetical protein